MAKKEKKQKKAKDKPEKKRRKGSEEAYPNIPYPGADSTKTFLAKLLVFLCLIGLGLMIYTIHYIRYIDRKAQDAATAAAVAASSAAETAPEFWYTTPDGAFLRAGDLPAVPQAPAAQEQPEEPADGEAEETPGEQESGEEEESTAVPQ